ncbi:MAG: ATP-binding cassette domain-containing protein [Planctomycetaceae bacterium]
MTNHAVRLEGVTKTFGSHTAVRDLDLAIPEGSIYGFIGPNGSGKTTTIRMILRIFFPDRGRIEVLGQAEGKCADDRVGYLPEERGLYRRMKVRDLLRYYARLKGFRDCDSEITSWLKRLGAEDWGNRKIESLSKGMSQKVQFVASVIARPQLLILDEPFSGLDPVNLELLREAIQEVRSRGTTIIFSTHEMDVAERMCERVFMIHNGNKVLDGTVAEIQRRYPADEVRIRFAEGETAPQFISGVEAIETRGPFLHMKLKSGEHADDVLKHLATTTRMEHFELLRPSLHNIFIRIAGPAAAVPADAKTTAI